MRAVDIPAARAASFSSSFPNAEAASAKAPMTEEKRIVIEFIGQVREAEVKQVLVPILKSWAFTGLKEASMRPFEKVS